MKAESAFSVKYKMELKILILLCVLVVCDVQGDETTEQQSTVIVKEVEDPLKPQYNVAFFTVFSPNVAISSGGIIHYKWIVTAASCVRKYSFSEIRFRHGGNFTTPAQGQTHFNLGGLIYDIIYHPSYVELTRANDIALINTLENIPVQPYRITRTNPNILSLEVILRGYGLLNAAVEEPSVIKLSEVSATLTSIAQCHKYDATVPTNKLCSIRGRNCKGDQGGPLVLKSNSNELIGVISVSAGVDSLCDFGVTPIETYTNIFLYRQWIMQILGLTNI